MEFEWGQFGLTVTERHGRCQLQFGSWEFLDDLGGTGSFSASFSLSHQETEPQSPPHSCCRTGDSGTLHRCKDLWSKKPTDLWANWNLFCFWFMHFPVLSENEATLGKKSSSLPLSAIPPRPSPLINPTWTPPTPINCQGQCFRKDPFLCLFYPRCKDMMEKKDDSILLCFKHFGDNRPVLYWVF